MLRYLTISWVFHKTYACRPVFLDQTLLLYVTSPFLQSCSCAIILLILLLIFPHIFLSCMLAFHFLLNSSSLFLNMWNFTRCMEASSLQFFRVLMRCILLCWFVCVYIYIYFFFPISAKKSVNWDFCLCSRLYVELCVLLVSIFFNISRWISVLPEVCCRPLLYPCSEVVLWERDKNWGVRGVIKECDCSLIARTASLVFSFWASILILSKATTFI